MNQTAKVFKTGCRQAVRLPAAFRFDTEEVFVHKEPETWGAFFKLLRGVDVPHDFLDQKERIQNSA